MEGVRFSIDADRGKNWLFLAVWILISTPVVAAICGLGVFIDQLDMSDFLPVVLLGVVVAAIYGSTFCLGWLRTTATVRYEVDDADLTVFRRRKVVVRIPRQDVDAFEMEGLMNVRRCLIDVAPPPEWPYGRVWYHEGHARRQIVLPEIMIWGSQERARVESEIRRALGLEDRQAG